MALIEGFVFGSLTNVIDSRTLEIFLPIIIVIIVRRCEKIINDQI